MMRFCFHATLTHSESRTLAIQYGIRFASFRLRASLTIFQRSHVSLSPSRTTHTAGMAQCYFSILSVMDARIAGSWLARQNRGEPLFSFCGTWLRREQHSLTSIAAPMIYFRHLRFGQMRQQSPNKSVQLPRGLFKTGRFCLAFSHGGCIRTRRVFTASDSHSPQSSGRSWLTSTQCSLEI